MAVDEQEMLGIVNDIDARFKEFDELHEICQSMQRDGAAAERLMALQESVDADLREGSVGSLLRAKDKLNALIDDMIKSALDAAS